MEIIAHRGLLFDRHVEQENSIRAFTNALTMGCPMIELDVRRTRDHHLIVAHDPFFYVKGERVVIGRYRLEQLINAGDVTNHYDDAEPGQTSKIPTLELVLKLFLRDIKINIELKGSWTGEPLAGTLIRLLGEQALDPRWLNKITVSSFALEELRGFRQFFRDIPAGYLSPTLFSKNAQHTLFSALQKENVQAVHLSKDIVSQELVADYKKAGFLVRVYTVNDTKMLPFYKEWGVDGIFTDKAGEFLAALQGVPYAFTAS